MVRRRPVSASSSRRDKGFTLIELMAVIVIIGILAAIALANFVSAQKRAKISSTKANMHVVQTMLELYASKWDSHYPVNITQLVNDSQDTSTNSSYWKDFANPFAATLGSGESYTDEASASKKMGIVTYDPQALMNNRPTQYYVYGYEDTNTRIQDTGRDFYLTNG